MAVSLQILSASPSPARKPSWLKMKMPGGKEFAKLYNLVNDHRLHTVCQSAKCPNMGECWAAGTATLMILGDVCTRSCGFCNIATGKPQSLDLDEPYRVGDAVRLMNLKHVVITSVNRDELADGGAAIWAHTIREVRRQSPARGAMGSPRRIQAMENPRGITRPPPRRIRADGAIKLSRGKTGPRARFGVAVTHPRILQRILSTKCTKEHEVFL